ncbi:MAG: hypothetical protein MUF10_05800 [Thermoanaerobaculaceae bacterium]|jgi:hypothetical protein|nr:hypothetical protein [Thermoanaerobaculaceae bacterium]
MGSLFLVVGLLMQVVPIGLAILAIAHIVRNGSDWWWIPLVLFFPLLGPVAYFLSVGALGAAGKGAGPWRQYSSQRAARTRIAEAQARLQHAPLPAVAAELAEDLASLGRHAEAEVHFRAALAKLPDRLDIAHGLALSLMAQSRCAEALPLLETVCARDPRFRYGDALLRLAQCLGESGQDERQEAVLRELGRQSNNAEGRVRLAALLARTGRLDEARQLATVLLRDAPAWPRYLRNQNRRWVRLARQLAGGQAPAMPTAASLLRTRRVPVWALVGAGAVVTLLVLVLLWVVLPSMSYGSFTRAERAYSTVCSELAALDQPLPAGAVVATPDRLGRYLRVREATAPAVAALLAAQRGLGSRENVARWLVTPGDIPGRAMEAHLAFLRSVQAALREAGLRPAELRAVGDVAEWRFLRRPGAEAFALPYGDWASLVSGRATLRASASAGMTDPNVERWREQARAEVQQVEAKLAALAGPARPEEVAALEAVRPRLEALPVAGSEHLAYLLEGPIDDILAEFPVGE